MANRFYKRSPHYRVACLSFKCKPPSLPLFRFSVACGAAVAPSCARRAIYDAYGVTKPNVKIVFVPKGTRGAAGGAGPSGPAPAPHPKTGGSRAKGGRGKKHRGPRGPGMINDTKPPAVATAAEAGGAAMDQDAVGSRWQCAGGLWPAECGCWAFAPAGWGVQVRGWHVKRCSVLGLAQQ